jgi:hypothetical protein
MVVDTDVAERIVDSIVPLRLMLAAQRRAVIETFRSPDPGALNFAMTPCIRSAHTRRP